MEPQRHDNPEPHSIPMRDGIPHDTIPHTTAPSPPHGSPSPLLRRRLTNRPHHGETPRPPSAPTALPVRTPCTALPLCIRTPPPPKRAECWRRPWPILPLRARRRQLRRVNPREVLRVVRDQRCHSAYSSTCALDVVDALAHRARTWYARSLCVAGSATERRNDIAAICDARTKQLFAPNLPVGLIRAT